jgi:GNAT superfamily N-acetyltransferase
MADQRPFAGREAVVTPHGVPRLRPEAVSDEPFLFALHASIRSDDFASMPVADDVRQELLDMQFRAMTAGYRSRFPAGRFEVVTLNDAPIGRLITAGIHKRFHIVHIVLLPEWRNNGFATALMTGVLDGPRRQGFACEAIVALGNDPSLRLWSRLGFTERARDTTGIVLEWRPAESGSPIQAAIGATGLRPPPAR